MCKSALLSFFRFSLHVQAWLVHLHAVQPWITLHCLLVGECGLFYHTLRAVGEACKNVCVVASQIPINGLECPLTECKRECRPVHALVENVCMHR
eukprot:m.33610 g.33610  ORF g.33610 m.33610 type:complete len:95 (-) comp9648_c0_seq1:306-590(-)